MIRVDRTLTSVAGLDALTDTFILRGLPEHLRSATGPEVVTRTVPTWSATVALKSAFIDPSARDRPTGSIPDPPPRRTAIASRSTPAPAKTS
ncbi:MAG: hypothetical protein AAGI50_10050 [Pseudomonadota bacterium]